MVEFENIKVGYILEIGIDDVGRLYIVPENLNFSNIKEYTEDFVWVEGKTALFIKKPTGFASYIRYYRELISVISFDLGHYLSFDEDTLWVNIDEGLIWQFTISLVYGKWQFKTSTEAGFNCLINGVDIWTYDWIDTDEKFLAKDPLYYQLHVIKIYEINTGKKKIRFGAAEFSNTIWGIFLETK